MKLNRSTAHKLVPADIWHLALAGRGVGLTDEPPVVEEEQGEMFEVEEQ